MIDINMVRKEPEKLKKSQEHRGEDPNLVDEIARTDGDWRKALDKINDLRHVRNTKSMEIREIKKEGGDIASIVQEMKSVNDEINDLENKVEDLKSKRDKMLMAFPNIVHESVPKGADESGNQPVRGWGKAGVHPEDREIFKEGSMGKMEYTPIDERPVSHVDLLENAGKADFLRASKVSASRFYYLMDEFVVLDLALQSYSLDFLRPKGYRIVNPPYMLNRKAYLGVTDLGAFEDTLYKVEGEDLYLIATSEHPMASMFMDEIIEPGELPKKFAGVSPCFRKEAGTHGKDTKGIFRVHQFNKTEQFVYCEPEESWDFHEELIKNAEELYQGLELPYRIVNICTGDLGTVASKKYDLEVWMPVQGRFREMVSVSNALDYQARRLNTRIRGKEDNYPPHMVNGTGIATGRTISAIIENHQTEGGGIIKIPKALRKYTGFEEIVME